MNIYRTHTCGELNISHKGQKIILSGWINKKRDHGNLLFIDLRDNYGLTQCVVDNENKVFKEIENLQLETVIKISGGGIENNIKRVIPKNLCANIELNKIKIQKIFKWLKNSGISNKEMLKTFNCGVGFCLIIDKKYLNEVKMAFDIKYKPYVIGKISKNKKKINLSGKINW